MTWNLTDVILNDRQCENPVHTSTGSVRTGSDTRQFKYLAVRPELRRRTPIEVFTQADEVKNRTPPSLYGVFVESMWRVG